MFHTFHSVHSLQAWHYSHCFPQYISPCTSPLILHFIWISWWRYYSTLYSLLWSKNVLYVRLHFRKYIHISVVHTHKSPTLNSIAIYTQLNHYHTLHSRSLSLSHSSIGMRVLGFCLVLHSLLFLLSPLSPWQQILNSMKWMFELVFTLNHELAPIQSPSMFVCYLLGFYTILFYHFPPLISFLFGLYFLFGFCNVCVYLRITRTMIEYPYKRQYVIGLYNICVCVFLNWSHITHNDIYWE